MKAIKRLVGGLLVAVALSAAVTAGQWNPICVLYTPDDPQYWFFFCWIDPPPGDPHA